MTQHECEGCGLSVYDLPGGDGDPYLVRATFFEVDKKGDLYCRGCSTTGAGTWR